MKQHKEFFIKYSLEKAENAIKEAKFNLDNDFLNIAVTRTYYSMFYAVTALGYFMNFKTGKHYQLKETIENNLDKAAFFINEIKNYINSKLM